MSQEGIVDVIGNNPQIPTTFIADVGSATPILNTLELLGEVVVAGTNPFRSIGSGNTITYQVQIAQAIAATDPTKLGLSAFNSADFTVDASGLVSLVGGGMAVDSFSPDSGTDPVVPNGAGLVNLKGSGSITTVGSLNTITTELTGLTNHAVLVGAGTATITKVAPSATSGVPLISQGAAADPAFGTAVVAGGGTGDTSFTAYAVICGGTTSTNPLQSVASVGSSGQVLTSNGAGALPTFQTNAGGDVTGPGSSTDNALVRFDGTTGKLIQNGVITEDDTGNLSISASVSGASLSALVANTSNTASATAFYNAQVAGSTAADSYYKAEISGGQAWTMGLDNSDSDAFVISATATPGTTNVMRVATTGEVNFPLQSAFLAHLNANDTNATGNGATYTLGTTGTALTEDFDQNSDFNTNGTFTAPVTGRYLIGGQFVMGGITAAMTYVNVNLSTSNATYPYGYISPGPIRTGAVAPDSFSITGQVLCDMDAADTFTTAIGISGGAGNTATVGGSGSRRVNMYGSLIC